MSVRTSEYLLFVKEPVEPNALLGGLTTKEGPTVARGRVLVEKEERWVRVRDDSSLFGGLRPCKNERGVCDVHGSLSPSLSLPLPPSLPLPFPYSSLLFSPVTLVLVQAAKAKV